MQRLLDSTHNWFPAYFFKAVALRSGSAIALLTLSTWCAVSGGRGLAQSNPSSVPPNQFPPSPLEITTPDPLLPRPLSQGPLTQAEQQALIPALNALDAQAMAQLKAGNPVGAFDTWNRELRLRRALGPLAEVQALGRVGSIAWEENQVSQVRIITERLQAIQQQAEAPAPPQPPVNAPRGQNSTVQNSAIQNPGVQNSRELQQALGQAYQQVRAREEALSIYEQLLDDTRQRKDFLGEELTLSTIGSLHLAWFDYPNAATTYQELLFLIRDRGPAVPVPPRPTPAPARPGQPPQPQQPLTEAEILQKLAYIYEQDRKPEQAIAVQQQLFTVYQKNPQQITLLPSLKFAIAKNHEEIGQLNQAVEAYRDTYTLAQAQQQLSFASDALQRLGELYRSNNQLDAALRMYQFLLDVEQQAYNFYGRMNAYDQIAQIHLSQNNYPQALQAYRNALELAKQLKFKEDYFLNQITEVNQKRAGQ